MTFVGVLFTFVLFNILHVPFGFFVVKFVLILQITDYG